MMTTIIMMNNVIMMMMTMTRIAGLLPSASNYISCSQQTAAPVAPDKMMMMMMRYIDIMIKMKMVTLTKLKILTIR